MINIVIAFVILAGSMYLAFRSVDAISARFNLFPKRHKPQSKTERLVESITDGLQIAEHSICNHQAIASCEIEGEKGAGCLRISNRLVEIIARDRACPVSTEVTNNAEGLAEGMQALAESAGEHVSAIVEGLSYH